MGSFRPKLSASFTLGAARCSQQAIPANVTTFGCITEHRKENSALLIKSHRARAVNAWTSIETKERPAGRRRQRAAGATRRDHFANTQSGKHCQTNAVCDPVRS